MTDEPENFIDNASAIAKNWTGSEMGPEEILQEFHLYGNARRAAALDGIDRQLKNVDDSNLRKVSDLIELRGALGAAHRRLRDAGR